MEISNRSAIAIIVVSSILVFIFASKTIVWGKF